MRILHLITTVDVGGAEMHLLSQVRGQAARGHSVRVRYLKGEGRLVEDFLGAGAEAVERVGLGGLLRDIRWAEIVHTHLLKADALGGVLASLAGRRRGLVSGKHNDERALLNPWVGRLHGVLGNLPRRTIPLSDHVARFTEQHGGVPLSKQTRIHYGIDPAPFQAASAAQPALRAELRASLGAEPEAIVFVCVARFAPQKAHDVLLRAFRAALDAAARPLALWLVGDDPFGDGRERAEKLAEELRLGDSVRFTGIRRDVPQLMAAADVFVMSSLWEGLGLVFLEAMACGRPVLASGVSAVPEVVIDECTGLLVPPSDDAALCAGMLRLAGDAELRERLGRAGEARVLERFGIDAMVDSTLEVYRALLEGGE